MQVNQDIITARQVVENLQANINCPEYRKLSKVEQKWLAIEVAIRLGFGEKHLSCWFDGEYPKVEKILKGIIATDFPPQSLLLSGTIGIGKSAFLSAIFKERFKLWAKQVSCKAYVLPTIYAPKCYYITHKELVDIVLAGFNDKFDSDTTFEELKVCSILMIDDLIANVNESTSNLGYLGELIDHRWNHNLTTWITSNVSAEDIKKRPGWERIYSRFADEGWMKYIWIKEKDRRKL